MSTNLLITFPQNSNSGSEEESISFSEFHVPQPLHYTKPVPFVLSSALQTPSPSLPPPNSSSTTSVANFYQEVISFPNKLKQKRRHQARLASSEHQKKIWCADCEIYIPTASKTRHIHSTPHLFVHSSDVPIPDVLTLNETNKGFQMLRAAGWEYDKGLGKDGDGRRHPVPTVLKNDTIGLGAKRRKKKVTHEKGEIEMEYKKKRDTLAVGKRELVRREGKDREKRLKMMEYMNT